MFPVTRKSLIERIQLEGEDCRTALGDWFNAYHPPMRRFVVARFRTLAQDADDVVNGFVSRRVVEGPLLKQYAPDPDRQFRSLLQAALANYCRDIIRARQRAQKRQGGPIYSVDEELDNPGQPGPDSFDVLWMRQVLGRAIRLMKKECERARSPSMIRVWGVFEARFLRPFRGKPETPYDELVDRYRFSSPGVAQKDATKGKQMLAEALRSVVSEYAGSDNARSELDDLWRIVRQLGGAGSNPTRSPNPTVRTRSET